MNWFLYILECIFEVFITMSGGSNKPMVTTGEMVTGLDLFVGVCGFFAPIILIFVIISLIKFFHSKKEKSYQKARDEYYLKNKEKYYNKNIETDNLNDNDN